MKLNRLIAFCLALVLAFGLVACGSKTPAASKDPTPSAAPSAAPSSAPSAAPSTAPTAEPTAEPTPTPSENVASGSDLEPYPGLDDPSIASDSDLNPYAPGGSLTEIKLTVLSGPTGVGAVKLLADSIMGLTANAYNFSIASDNSQLVAGLSNGDIDIATMASNMALNLYNKTDGDVQIIALGTLGVLHILEGSNGTSVKSVADLKGKTIYSVGQGANPEYILRYILTKNGIDPDKDVDIIFAEPAEITQKLLSGTIDVALLPVPAATTAISKSAGSVRSAIDLTEAWSKASGGSQLIMTAVVARTEFVRNNPAAVAAFLKEYEASIRYTSTNLDDAAQLVYDFGLVPSAAIAKQAIPQCNLVFISGKDMAPAISNYFAALYELDPASVGGALPDDGIYYVP